MNKVFAVVMFAASAILIVRYSILLRDVLKDETPELYFEFAMLGLGLSALLLGIGGILWETQT